MHGMQRIQMTSVRRSVSEAPRMWFAWAMGRAIQLHGCSMAPAIMPSLPYNDFFMYHHPNAIAPPSLHST